MDRVYLPLLPLPILAVLVAVSACSKPRSEETTHVIPPAVTLLALPAEAKPPGTPPEVVVAPPAEDTAPTPEDVKEFSRKVMK